MKLHHYFRVFSITVEDEVSWFLCDLDEPVEAFKPNVRDVHINSAMSIYQGQPNIVRSNLRLHWKFCKFNGLIDPHDLFLRKIVL